MSQPLFLLNWAGKNHFRCPNLFNGSLKMMRNNENSAKLKRVPPELPSFVVKMLVD
jgi:hypothetical protein